MKQHKPIKHNIAYYPPSSDTLFIANICKKSQSPTLVIANDGFAANRIYDELKLFAPELKVGIFADTEILPYERISPQKAIIASRIRTLWQIGLKQLDILIVQISALQVRLCPPEYCNQRVFILNVGDNLSIEDLRARLINSDYTNVAQVLESGEFSVRGGIIDIMPMGSTKLVRIDLFGSEIDTLQLIDSKTREIIESINSFELIPAREFPSDRGSLKQFSTKFNSKFPKNQNIYIGSLPAGSEFYAPLFFDNTANLFDYLDNTWQVIFYQNTLQHLQQNYQEINRRYELLQYQYPCLKPIEVFIPSEDIFYRINQLNSYKISEDGECANSVQLLPDISVTHDTPISDTRNNDTTNTQNTFNPFNKFADFLDNFNGNVILVVESTGRLEIIRQTLISYNITPQIIQNLAQVEHLLLQNTNNHAPVVSNRSSNKNLFITKDILYHGFIYNNYAFITEDNLYYKHTDGNLIKSRVPIRRKKGQVSAPQANPDSIIRDLAEIKVGDLVVHLNHGVGKYVGLTTQTIAHIEYEMLELEYKNEAKLFIPINNLHLISRYSQLENANATISQLGGNQWNKTKERTEKRINDLAASLLELYATRKIHQGHKFALPDEYNDFAEGFGYEPTIDQQTSFNAIIEDMQDKTPMDRLICGDVGFGKTEVAIRAAFICAMNGRQVAFLAPTTLLTEQHFQNFSNRFAGYPIKIAEISRFKTKKEIAQTLESVKSGDIDILIGTHRLIQDDVQFARLGLVIIDEEHRFGVKQKEKLKQLRANVDFLAMTATPIPRSLSMALDGLRDFSIIATPPQKRLAVNTIICSDDSEIIREAILRETRRGGQVFFLYNDVATINNMRDNLISLIPELQIAVAHGQMNETVLEQTIHDFIRQRHNLLLCSTIIETGIDIANANTIIIYRADKFGLSQLHQLRGRVGRSHHQAYCYLIIPANITRDAQLRLDAIERTTELGSGFNLAMHDLEIRGAGEILGDSQSGNIKEVGVSLYTEMLNLAVKKLKREFKQGQKDQKEEGVELQPCEVNLNTTSIISPDYLNNVHERLIYYKRFAKANTIEEVDSVYQDIIDNYGMPNDVLKHLVDSHYIRVKASRLGIKKLDANDKNITLTFIDKPPLNPIKITLTMQKLRTCRFDVKHRLIWMVPSSTNGVASEANRTNLTGNITVLTDRVKLITQLLDELSQAVTDNN
jgi:transcription-repair coupling factor (superfamily II helicase)